MAYGEMLMSIKKFAKAKDLFEDYLKNNPADSEICTLLQECETVLDKVRKFSQAVEKMR